MATTCASAPEQSFTPRPRDPSGLKWDAPRRRADSDGFLSTADIERAREAVTGIDFFEAVFGTAEADQADLHAQVMTTLLDETHGWQDAQVAPPPGGGGPRR